MLSKYVWSISVRKINFIRTCDMEEIKAMDCIIKVLFTSGNIKWRSFALRFCASNHKSAWQPLLPFAKGLSFIFIFYHHTRVMVIFTYSFLHFFFLASTLCWGDINYYCWHYPWGKRLGGDTISPYLSLCPIETLYP